MNNSLSFDSRGTGAWFSTLLLCLCSGAAMCAAGATNAQVSVQAPQGELVNAFPGFRIEKGFRLELVAGEPLVTAPMAMAFDEDGRLFVAEMGGPEGSGGPTQTGRIRMLQDTNEDGAFETSTVYVDNLQQPSALACYDGGLFVGTMADLVYLREGETNGAAGARAVILSGFGGTNNAGAPARLSNLNWGLDNRIHGVTGLASGGAFAVRVPGSPPTALVGSEIVLDPRTRTVSHEPGPSCSGLTFDNWGGEFVSELSRPILTRMYNPRYTERNPFFAPPRQMLDVASPATRIFRSAPAGPPGPGGVLARQAASQGSAGPGSSWLTNACGGVVYRGNAFPLGNQGNVFIADPQAHIVHREVLRGNGLEPVSSRPAEERDSEFLASQDASFRPVQVLNGPDGTLYVVDQQDGGGRGRIYRIVPLDFKRPKPPQLGKATTYDLAAMLSHPNGWQRDTAARLLYTQQKEAARLLLTRVLGASINPLARLHALHALEGAGWLSQPLLLQALRDRDWHVREHAVLLAEGRVVEGVLPDPLWNQLLTMTADPSVRVRYQLAFTLGEVRRPEKVPALVDILLRDPDNGWMQAAVLSSVREGAVDLFLALAGNAPFRNGQTGQPFLRRLANMVGAQGRQEDIPQVVGFIDRTALAQPVATGLFCSLGEGVYFSGGSLGGPDPNGRLRRLFLYAFSVAADLSAAVDFRIDALRLMSLGPDMFGNERGWLMSVFGGSQPPAVQSAALAVFGRYADPQVTPALIQTLPALSPALRRDAVAALLGRSSRFADVMSALQDGRINVADVASTQMNLLRTARDEAVRQSAIRLFGPVPLQRTEAVERFAPALTLKGAAERGRGTFAARCTACHRLGGEGRDLGPDLVAARVGGKSRILTAVLEPNAQVQPGGAACVVDAGSGEVLIGLRLSDSPAAVTLGQPNGVAIALSRANVLSVQPQSWSLMPAGLDEGLSTQDMADLLEYIMTAAR